MDAYEESTAGIERRTAIRARLGLGFFLGMTALLLAVSLSVDTTAPLVPPPGATTDVDYYRRIVDRVHRGDSYYLAAAEELRAHGYPTRSVFNWRTPLYAWLLGSAPGPEWGQWLLIAGTIVVVATFWRDLPIDFGTVPATVGVLFLVGATAWSLGDQAFLFMEVWAGVLIALSIAAYRRGWIALGFGAGLFAVFYRELALPYAIVAAGLAVWSGRKREVAAWGVGLLLFVAFMGYHATQVHARLTEADVALPGGWVRFGGLRFLLTTTQANIFLMPLPLWCTALYLPAAVLGMTAGCGEAGVRVGLTTALFLAAFSVVGNPFNFYWGFIDAPLLAIGVAGAPRAVSQLVSTAFDLRGRPGSVLSYSRP